MVVVPLRLQRGVVVARSSVEESPGSSEAFDGALAQSDVGWITTLELKLPYAERLIQSPYRAFGCFSLLILNDRAAPSYQLLDLSLAGLPLDRLFLIADLLSFEVGVLVFSLLDTCLPLLIDPIQHLTFDYLVNAQLASVRRKISQH
jgi:hypothetical protein